MGRSRRSTPWTDCTFGAWLLLRGTPYYDLEMFPMVADSIAMGCLLAMAGGWLEQKSWYLRLFRPAYSAGLLALVLLTNRFMGYTAVSVFGSSVINACLAILIHRSVYYSRDWIGTVLNWNAHRDLPDVYQRGKGRAKTPALVLLCRLLPVRAPAEGRTASSGSSARN